MLSDIHVDITIKRPENRPDCHCSLGYGLGCRNGTSFLRTRPSQTAFGPLPLVPRAASPAK